MKRVLLYTGLLTAGMAVAQFVNLDPWRPVLHLLTSVCLSYIMVEVGLEFKIDKRHVGQYATDFWIAAAAAALPWVLCALYFRNALRAPWKEAWLVGLFASPTSAGVLFAMLAAAGLSGTWVFKKARVLAIFDDLETLLLMIPLQMVFVGLQWQLFAVGAILSGLLLIAYRGLNRLRWPIGKFWLLLYGAGVAGLCALLERIAHIRLEVLLPAFALGSLLSHHGTVKEADDPHSILDQTLKALFMFWVGCSLPRISIGLMTPFQVFVHVAALTLLSNAGKCFPLLCYRREASIRERLALSVAMFPRGEVGAGILLVALGYGMSGEPVVLGSMSLALNLLLTGIFIKIVAELTRSSPTRPHVI